MIGKQAQVPIWSDLNSGGYTSTSAAGGGAQHGDEPGDQPGALHPVAALHADQPGVLRAQPVRQQLAVDHLRQEPGDQGAIETLRNQATRQLVTNGDGIVAQCATGGASATISLIASPSGTAWGYDAIVRNWLRPGAVIDVGTTADTDALLTAGTVTAVAESATARRSRRPRRSRRSGTHFVYIANPNSATAANPELNGLRNIVNTSGALGGLNPATAGQEFWQAAYATRRRRCSARPDAEPQPCGPQKTGAQYTDVWFGLKQQQNYYSLLQNQVRFAGD
jgi:hypothetical protein